MKLSLITAFTLVLALAPEARAQEATVGQAAPDFTLSDEAGREHSLSDYAGKIVVLEWINPECPYVVRHYAADTMETLASRYAASDVVWLSVNSSHFVTAEAAAAFKQEQGFAYPTLLDPEGTVGRMYGARTTPHMYVIDPAGTLVYAGGIDDDPRGRSESPSNFVDTVLTALVAGEPSPLSGSEPYGCSVKYE